MLSLILVTQLCLCAAGCGKKTESFNEKAMKAFMTGRQEEAIHFFKQTLALDSTDLNANFYLGWIYEMQGKLDEGIAAYNKALAIYPKHGGIYNRLGNIYLAKGMLDEALHAFNSVVMLNPNSANGYYALGVTYLQKGKSAEAADAFFESGMISIVSNEKDRALHAYNKLKETGNKQLAEELQAVLSPWFDPANDAVKQTPGSCLQQ